MEFRRLLTIALLAISFTALFPASALGGLLESMPAGSDFYLAFDPEAVGMDRFLESLASSGFATDGDMEQLRERLGFNPLSWDSWADSMALDSEGEIGLIVDMGESDVDIVALYLPTSDAAKVEGFFRSVFSSVPSFNGSLKFHQTPDHAIVLLGADPGGVAAFNHSGPSLGSDPGFMDMTGPDLRGTSLGSIYIDLLAMNEGEDLSSALFRAASDEDRLTMSLSARTVDPDLTRFASLLSPSSGEAQFGVPEGTDGTLRISVNMAALDSLLTSTGLAAEYDEGATALGLMSSSRLLSLLSGDFLLTVSSAQTNYMAILQIGLEDPASTEDLLMFIRTLVDGTEGDAITGFDMDGIPCYRVDFTIAPGMHTIEYGVIDDALVIAGGCSLRDPAEGMEYEGWIDDQAQDLDTGSAVLFSATSVLLQDLIGNDAGLARGFSHLSGSLNLAAASLDIDGDLFSLLVTLEPANGDPGSLVTRILTTFFLAVLFA